ISRQLAQFLAIRAARRHRPGPALLHQLRSGPAGFRHSAESTAERPPVRPLCQHRAGLLMRWRRLLAWIAGGFAGVAALLFLGLKTCPGQRALASLASGDGLEVSGLSGFFPTDMRVARVRMSDRDGTWLTVDDARLSWSFASLFSGRVRIDEAAARRIEIL